MDVLLAAFIAVLAAETGGRVQANVGLLSARFAGAGPFLLLLLTTLVSLAIGGLGGILVSEVMQERAKLLLVALSLMVAGATMFIPVRVGEIPAGAGLVRHGLPRLAASQLGDSSQFLVFALAAWSMQPVLSVLGGSAAVFAAAMLPIALAQGPTTMNGLARVRWIFALICLLVGTVLALQALRLI